MGMVAQQRGVLNMITGCEDKRLTDIVYHCGHLPMQDYISYVDELGRHKDFAALSAICRSDVPYNFLAAGAYAQYMDSDKVVSFCMQLPLSTWSWREAFSVLHKHPKEAVIGYIMQVATSKDPEVRAICYEVCQKAGWNDLRKHAEIDQHSKELLTSPGTPLLGTLGMYAKNYLESLQANKQ
jgi:hypothetical protein